MTKYGQGYSQTVLIDWHIIPQKSIQRSMMLQLEYLQHGSVYYCIQNSVTVAPCMHFNVTEALRVEFAADGTDASLACLPLLEPSVELFL